MLTTTTEPENNPSKDILYPVTRYKIIEPTTTTTTTTTTRDPNSHSIVPGSGYWNSIQTAFASGAFPETLSSARWSDNAQGFPQQTFLGASIRSFNMNGGFGDNSSSLTVDLVVDEFNTSDNTDLGLGDDIYWSGNSLVQGRRVGDKFVPPIPGSPVFFKFGPNYATIEEAYRPVFDKLYNYNTMTIKDPTFEGTASLDDVLSGKVNFTKDKYLDLYISDEIDGGSKSLNNSPRFFINYGTLRGDPKSKGKDHITFGGILQTFTQNRSPAGNPLYTVNVVDPREILSNVTLILNNYSGPTYEQKNILNIYGFLEYNATESTIQQITSPMPFKNTLAKSIKTNEPNIGSIVLSGDDRYYKSSPKTNEGIITNLKQQIKDTQNNIATEKRKISDYRSQNNTTAIQASYNQITTLSLTLTMLNEQLRIQVSNSYPYFPMTGTGFSRRSSQGIPFYRVRDGINALMGNIYPLPQEYKDQGFGGVINFRGYNYIIDFGGLPELPEFYFLDFDQINMMELILEICDITNRDVFVSLLPVIDHPACSNAYSYNNSTTTKNEDLIAGIIRIDTIDRSEQPCYGAVKQYIDDLKDKKIYVENQDLGYELSNVTTDKFIVGAQEIDMYFFSSNADRDTLAFRKTGNNNNFPNKPAGYQWTLDASLEQQILPYYGKLSNNVVTIPKGFGSYQQILLDASNLNAAGVGAYYVATEMELRCALVSFDRWKEFLKMYNETYMESIEADDVSDAAIVGLTPNTNFGIPSPPVNLSTQYTVTVPRSVFDTYALPISGSLYGPDGLPLSACNPPYGYPLYYKRMTRIGIPEGGLTDLYSRWVSLSTNLAELQCANGKTISTLLNSQFKNLQYVKDRQGLTPMEEQYYNKLKELLENPTPQKIQDTVAALENIVKGNGRSVFAILPTLAKKNNENAIKVYNFVKSIADECLGKKFLVKLPTEVNLFFDNVLMFDSNQEYTQGPFGFKPRSTRNIAGYEFTNGFKTEVNQARVGKIPPNINMIQSFLSSGTLPNPKIFSGALRVNYNPISEKYESNYVPMNIGGYFHFDLYQNTLSNSNINDIYNIGNDNLPLGVRQGMIPQDLTHFINEDGRITPYVRFDNSEDLTLEGLADGDFAQQYLFGNHMIPDLINQLENTGSDNFTFPNTDENANNPNNPNSNTNNQPKPKQVAFVKCSVDEQVYLAPKIITRDVEVHARTVKDIGTISIPQKVFIPCCGVEGLNLVPGSGVYLDSFTYYRANYVPAIEPYPYKVQILDFKRYNPYLLLPGGNIVNNSTFVDATPDQSGVYPVHAYAIITLPNRVIPNKDSRLRDGPLQSINAERFKHLMTMDVVRGLPGFDMPANPMTRPPPQTLQPSDLKITLDNKIHAWFAMKKAMTGLQFGLPQRTNFSVPSPVYPDLVALPLMSNDRCYGPWVSSQLDGKAYLLKNIGGRVEFIKDENLSPWNYGGYHLMNQAGRLQAEFSNSLLLFSERGAFTIADIPRGNSLCQALTIGGPLVTSINLDISTGGARTTYQMDLYTASFGKLQKQKQEEFSKMSRERKKLISERNALIRKGMSKNQSGRNLNMQLETLREGNIPGLNDLGLGMSNALTRITASVERQSRNTYSSTLTNPLRNVEYNTFGSIQNENMLGNTAQLFRDQNQLANNYYNSASADIVGQNPDAIFAPYSNGPHTNMAYRPNSNIRAHNSLLNIDNENISLDNDTTQHGDIA